ncbi:hypothetical protein BS329_37350 [Amycolatopsis coloradensis]|uniref:Uncharacterized protein n=1 Tax=Amycolatopsis coloradensis TaxID=76021 RepID=A0A1R0KFF4_9PSEU|nr:hypothetical protein BS329_37350 [Amycolatopsis coloradensis]
MAVHSRGHVSGPPPQIRGLRPKRKRGRDITLNAVAPGPTATALLLDGPARWVTGQVLRANGGIV